MPHNVYIGVGSNLGIAEANCLRAMDLLNRGPDIRLVRRSSLYRTKPAGPPGQRWYVNAAAQLSTRLPPAALLERLRTVEKRLGRVRRVRWGPRVIDLDILFYDRRVLHTPALEIPHPRIAERRFVLAPLFEIAPALVHPSLNKSVADLLAAAPGSQDDVRPFSVGASNA